MLLELIKGVLKVAWKVTVFFIVTGLKVTQTIVSQLLSLFGKN